MNFVDPEGLEIFPPSVIAPQRPMTTPERKQAVEQRPDRSRKGRDGGSRFSSLGSGLSRFAIWLSLATPTQGPEYDNDIPKHRPDLPCPDKGGDRERFALGMEKRGLRTFANEMDAGTWRDAPNPNEWWFFVVGKVLDPKVEKLFLLEGVNAMEGITRAASGRGGPTDKELLLIYQDKPDHVHWYKGTSGNYRNVGSPF